VNGDVGILAGEEMEMIRRTKSPRILFGVFSSSYAGGRCLCGGLCLGRGGSACRLLYPAKKISNPSILSNLSNLSTLLSIQRIFCNYLSSPSSFRVISPSFHLRLRPTGGYLSSSPIGQLSSPEDGIVSVAVL
jgi:hypothetical protein